MAVRGRETLKPLSQMTTADLIEIAKKIDKPTWIKIGIGAAIALVFSVVIVWPAWFQGAKVKGEIAVIESQIVRLQTLKRNEKMWLQNKEDYTKYIKEVKARLFSPGEASLLLGRIAKLADESKVSIISSSPRDGKVEFPKPFDDSFKADLYDFTVEGGYHEMAHFINRIESYPQILRVELFQLSPNEDVPGKHLAEITLSAVSKKDGVS